MIIAIQVAKSLITMMEKMKIKRKKAARVVTMTMVVSLVLQALRKRL